MARRKDAEQFNRRDEQVAVDLLTQLHSTPRGRRALIILVVCAVLIAGGYWLITRHASSPAIAGPTVRIATWNMHVFAPRPAIRLDTIASIIRSSKFDVVAMQEIRENGEEVDALLGQLNASWHRSPFSAITGNHERFVFIFNTDHVQEIGPAHSIDLSVAHQFSRTPYEDTFQSGPFTFKLITCHLYYGEGSAGHQRRAHETQLLAAYANDEVLVRRVPDVIVLGDFNEMNGVEGNLHFFRDLGWETLNADPTNLHGSEIYDNLLIDPKVMSQWDGTAGSIHFDLSFAGNDKLAVESVSDHRPAYADFLTGAH
ncbi:MAG: endonuclease/exonuclease/phosphatase family protein [Phycisphaerae bacterium]|nr:endonuclease/exonuclease/phosphatase family protein [Phycisphaerae bacterium]